MITISKKISLTLISSMILVLTVLFFVPLTVATPYSNATFATAPLIDTEDDITAQNTANPLLVNYGNFAGAIDVTNLTVSGQIITIAFQKLWDFDGNDTASCYLYIDIDDDGVEEYTLAWDTELFSTNWSNSVWLFNETGGYWNGSTWVDSGTPASVGSAMFFSITIMIPIPAFTVQGTDEYFIATSWLSGIYLYYDTAPNATTEPIIIPGFEWVYVFLVIVGIVAVAWIFKKKSILTRIKKPSNV